MPTSSPLQDSLFSRQPDLHWLLDANGNLIEPLLHQWGQQLQRTHHYTKPFVDTKDVLLWAIEKNASAPALQSTFDWLHKIFVGTQGHAKGSDAFLHTLKEEHPALLQTLLQNVAWKSSVWDTSFAFKYAPDPKALWTSRPDWQQFYTGSNPLAWTKKESTHPNATAWAYPDQACMQRMHDTMGRQAFLLWQYGAYMALLTQNTYSSTGAPSGRKYGLAAALTLLEPAITLGLAPDAEDLAQDTVRRYKGKDLVEDMLKGIDYCMEQYEENGLAQGVEYCTKMLSTLIPHAIKEGLTAGANALGMDKKITHSVHTGRITEALAQTWFEARLRTGRSKHVDFKAFSPKWPEGLRKQLVELESEMQREPKKAHATTMRALFELWSYEPTASKALLDSMTPAQWGRVQETLDSDSNTNAVVSLLQTPHPWVETYKSSPRARIAVVAACMIFINEPKYVLDPRYRGLAGLFSTNSETPVGMLSMPQPLAYFATCFPQYRQTWQRLACEMAEQNPMGTKANVHRSEEDNMAAAKKVVNALASLMLGKSVDAESLLSVRNMLDPNMTYEALVQSQFNAAEVFELPATFNESMFSGDSIGM